MKRLLVALAVSSALVAPAFADPESVISVIGEAQVSAQPDLATIDGGVTTEAKTARDASDSNNAAMGKVLLALKGAGIPEKDVQTQRLSLQPQYTANPKGPGTVSGYRASNRVLLKLRDMTLLAPTIDLIVNAGANEIGGIAFKVAQPSKLLDDARSEAIADARRKAEIYAKAAGVTLGPAVSIVEDGAAQPMILRSKVANSFAARAPTPVSIGEETLRISVSVAWAIKPPAAEPAPVQPAPVPPVPVPAPTPAPPVPPAPIPPAPIPPAPAPKAE